MNERVREELTTLLDHGFKIELDALANDMARLTRYLQRKLESGNLVKL